MVVILESDKMEIPDMVEPQHKRSFEIDPKIGSETIIELRAGKILAKLLRNGKSIQQIEIKPGEKKTLQIPESSSENDKYTVEIIGLADNRSQYDISGNVV